MALQKGEAVLHAVGSFDTTAGAIIAAGTGNWTAANVAVGIADITLGDAVDTLERLTFLQSRTAGIFGAVIPASATDTNERVHLESNASVDTDGPLDFMIIRVAG